MQLLKQLNQQQRMFQIINSLNSRLISFHFMHQGQATNLITKGINSRIQVNQITGNGVVLIEEKIFTFLDYKDNIEKISSTAKQLFIALCIQATRGQKNESTVRLPLEEYMKMRGLSNRKGAMRQVRADLKILTKIHIAFEEKKNGIMASYLNMNLFGGTEGVVNGIIVFKFNSDFFVHYKNSKRIASIPEGLLKLNLKHHPNSFYFLEKITSHKSMNYMKSNVNIIRVSTLLRSTPFIPKYEEIKGKGEIARRIIKPFERDMDAVKDSLSWRYCGPKGTQIDHPAGYWQFVESLILITWNNYPEREKR